MIAMRDELIHYGIPGQKWGVRRYQNPDGTWTDEGLARRYSRLNRYRDRLVDRSSRKAAKARSRAKDARGHYENVDKYGKGSREYAQYVDSKMKSTSEYLVKDPSKRAANAFSNLGTYSKYYGPFDMFGEQKQAVSDLKTRYKDNESYWNSRGRKWMKAHGDLMKMDIDAVTTTRRDIRRTMKKHTSPFYGIEISRKKK